MRGDPWPLYGHDRKTSYLISSGTASAEAAPVPPVGGVLRANEIVMAVSLGRDFHTSMR